MRARRWAYGRDARWWRGSLRGGEVARTRPCQGVHFPWAEGAFRSVLRGVLSPKKEGARLLVNQEANLRGGARKTARLEIHHAPHLR